MSETTYPDSTAAIASIIAASCGSLMIDRHRDGTADVQRRGGPHKTIGYTYDWSSGEPRIAYDPAGAVRIHTDS